MVSTCFYFQVHQPRRIRQYSVFDIGNANDYFNGQGDNKLNNKGIIYKVAEKCYFPANYTILNLINQIPEFKASYSLSGILIEQLEEYAPDVLNSFQELADTGNVEFLSETYHHSLASIYSLSEFRKQIEMHKRKIKRLFGQTPKVFRNTELVYNNQIAKFIEELGYKGILAEGWDHVLGWRSPNFVYKPVNNKIKLLLKNYRLSDDVAFRFSERSWSEWPLNAEKYANWINSVNGNGTHVNLFMDYETFGEHQWASTGIFDFLKALPKELLKHPDNDFKTPSEIIKSYKPVGEVDVRSVLSWADAERDLSAWMGNQMQQSALRQLYDLEPKVLNTQNDNIIELWRKLQTSDHFYYMCTKWFADGDVHKYFNPYETPYDAFISFMNALNDLKLRIKESENEAIQISA